MTNDNVAQAMMVRRFYSSIASELARQTLHRLLAVVVFAFCVSLLTPAFAQGLPLIRNFTAAEYGAHNRNFDIEIGDDGTVFVANFEGLLYYDRAQWRILHTPDISRITVAYRACDGTIWVGGYNFFARIVKRANGELAMQRVGREGLFRGEVKEIFEKPRVDHDPSGKTDNIVQFVASDNNIYEVQDTTVVLKKRTQANFHIGIDSEIVSIEALEAGHDDVVLNDITQEEPLSYGLKVKVKKNNGLIVVDSQDRELYVINESNGLCSNQVAYVVYDDHGILWGATSHGIFAIEMLSPYSYLLPKDGLSGEVHAITSFGGKMYFGGSNGLFVLHGHVVERVGDLNSICWVLQPSPKGLLAATSSGMYLIAQDGSMQRLSTNSTTAILVDGKDIYAGEHAGVYLYSPGQAPKNVCGLNQTTKILNDSKGDIYLQNVYGEVYCKRAADDAFRPLFDDGKSVHIARTIVKTGDAVSIVSALDTLPFPYPAFSTMDMTGTTWLTDKDGHSLYQWRDGKRQTKLNRLLTPMEDMNVGALYRDGSEIWVGGDDVLSIIDTDHNDLASLAYKDRQIRFCSIVMQGDSVLWGGYGDMPHQLPMLGSDEHHLRFVYSLDYSPLSGNTLYRYRMNDDRWSAWSEKQEAEFLNLPYGTYTLRVQARMANGELSDVASVSFSIAFPLFMRPYMIVLYVILMILFLYALFRYRLKKLQRDKLKLERIVDERTSEVVKQKDEIVRQKDEIEEKSRSLEKALDDLNNAQHELIRQEKMASVGKLTEGLIDRILNPMNYIINFSKMSNDLLKDIKANIENNKDNMDPDDYEDTEDVLGMMTQNLQSVEQYGQNTTRTLKAMEEMLKDRTGGYVDMDLLPVLQQDEEMLNTYYAKEKEQFGIRMTFTLPQGPMPVHGNPDMLSKVIMSLLANAVYAVVKRAQKTLAGTNGSGAPYAPEISLSVTTSSVEGFVIKVRDNGIGIEEKILDKIFDPFFTTKTTDEASGVGLYLSREIIQNHKGDISVTSIKDQFTECTVTLPSINNSAI